ncbi:hypothetical protein M011DRAFT_472144 [Sporormia fimetaria CBS 119925]|uniref:Uncharacterized protein n=1 Tax=Sporormia fimetaria CBS 119925 TaxID=1340428 RepID=A0A6A6UXR4_9PLEO|nr:hypothetical protein M011DRAFT_472144 [Sporormia fimetaria CBS 119925]
MYQGPWEAATGPPCHVCTRMRTSNPKKHSGLREKGLINQCLLCNRNYCDAHKSKTEKDGEVCEINHQSYCDNHPLLRAQGVEFPTMEAYRKVVEEQEKQEYENGTY